MHLIEADWAVQFLRKGYKIIKDVPSDKQEEEEGVCGGGGNRETAVVSAEGGWAEE